MEYGPFKSTLEADLSELDRVHELVNYVADRAGVDPGTAYSTELALTEAFTNIVRHAYPEKRNQENVSIELSVEEGALICTLVDDGVPFDQSVARLKKDAIVEGVNGLSVMAASVDEISYLRSGETNVLSIRKSIQGG